MSRTVIDLDDEALEEATKELGTTTKRHTINAALQEVTARYRRLRALDEARTLAAEGALDMDLLLDKSKYQPTSTTGNVPDTKADKRPPPTTSSTPPPSSASCSARTRPNGTTESAPLRRDLRPHRTGSPALSQLDRKPYAVESGARRPPRLVPHAGRRLPPLPHRPGTSDDQGDTWAVSVRAVSVRAHQPLTSWCRCDQAPRSCGRIR